MSKFHKLEGFTDEEFNEYVDPVSQELIQDFLRQSQKSDQTLKQYKSALYIFARFVHDELRNKPITQLKVRDALRYQNHLIDLGLSDSSIKFKRSAVSALYIFIEAFWEDEYPDTRNIFTKAVPNVGNTKKKTKDPLTLKEMEKLKNKLIELEEWQKLAYLTFTYSTGCRREESRQLRKEVASYGKYKNAQDVEKNYYVTHDIRAKGRGKQGKVRKFQFDDESMEYIRKWVEVRGEDDNEFLFVAKNKDGKTSQVSASTFNTWCEHFTEILGKKVHPHLLRSSRATNSVVEEGKDIKAVQQLLGHESSSTTEIYIVADNSDDLDELF